MSHSEASPLPGRAPAPRAGQRLQVIGGRVDPDGWSRCDGPPGWEVRVPGLLPGEAAEVSIERRAQGGPVLWAASTRLHRAHGARRAPPCPLVDRCGGCAFMHVRETDRLVLLVESALDGAPAQVRAKLAPLQRWLNAASPFGYRHKAILLPARRGRGLALGGFARHSHSVVDLPGCGVLAPALVDARERLRRALDRPLLRDRRPIRLPGDPPVEGAALRAIVLRANRAGEVVLTFVVTHDEAAGWLEPIARVLVEGPGAVRGVSMHVHDAEGDAVSGSGPSRVLAGRGRIDEQVGPLAFEMGALSFFQVNPAVLQDIARWVRAETVDGPILDLYCGAGVMGLSAAHGTARSVIGVDVDATAITAARAAATKAGITATFHAGPTLGALAGAPSGGTLILDPPRSGCRPADLEAALALAPERVLLIACHHRSLLRDAERITAAGYHLVELIPVDLLPQTGHVEWLARFDRGEDPASAGSPPGEADGGSDEGVPPEET